MGSFRDDPVWYACYGSNCSQARFATYLTGGSPPGASMVHAGARDPSPPQDQRPVTFSSQICFAGYAASWGGAPAFLQHQTNLNGAWGKGYLISSSQFADVFDQENQRAPGTTALPELTSLEPGTLVTLGSHRYDALVVLAPVDGVPCLSFTDPNPPETRTPAAPSAAYLGTIARGLRACHSVSAPLLAEHLLRAPGVAPTWDHQSLLELISPA